MSGQSGRQLRVGLSGAFVVLAGVAVYWAALPRTETAGTRAPVAEESGTFTPSRGQTANVPSPSAPVHQPKQLPVPVDSEQATVAEYTARKYQLLFDDLHVPKPDPASLQQALLARERIAGQAAGEQREQALAAADQRIRSLLHPADFATYQALADSDLEQFQLEQYAGGVSNVAPLGAEERKAILRTKLAYKQRFHQLAQDAGLLRAGLGREEREYALGVASRALADYQHDYLQEIRQYIANDEQFALLANYENTEFTAQLAKLRE